MAQNAEKASVRFVLQGYGALFLLLIQNYQTESLKLFAQNGPTQVCPPQVGPSQVGVGQISPAQIG